MGKALKLPQRVLGSTGLSVSVLGLGTVKFGRNQKIRYADFQLPDDRTICRLLDDALEYGINLLDTAPAYGLAEERLGKLLGGRRDDFSIVTKTGEEFGQGVSTYDFSAKHTRQSIERSLRRLGTDRLECVLVHCSHDDLADLRDSPVLETLHQLKSSGDIRSFGASTYTIEGGLFALAVADVVMVASSIDDDSSAEVIQKAGELRKGVLIKKGLGSGKLTGGFAPEHLEVNFRRILARGCISSLVIGTINREHLLANALAARDIPPFRGGWEDATGMPGVPGSGNNS